MNDKPRIKVFNLGVTDYATTWNLQTRLQDLLIRRKRNQLSVSEQGFLEPNVHFLLCCGHQPVYTLGKSGQMEHLKLSEDNLSDQGFQFFKINRGGDITYHGPGQLVAYPIMDLDCFFTDLHKYVRYLEESIIRLLQIYGIEAYRNPKHTGVWVRFDQDPIQRKICAIGVHMSRWVSMHGLAFNIQSDLRHFDNIIPCGIQEPDTGVCSMHEIVGNMPARDQIISEFSAMFSDIFEADWGFADTEELAHLIES
jgi:lipoyl(octanoyl) transferase